MASQSRVYTDRDIRLMKWTFIMTRVASRPLRLILQNETVGKGNDESYFDYFKRNHKKLKNLHTPDEDFLKDLNTKLEDLDITLLYKIIRHGNRKLANGGEKDKWKWEKGNSHIESLITRVKDLRNELFHKEPQISKKEFQDRTEELRKLLTDLMSCVAIIYSIDVTQELDQVNKDIDKYRDNDIEDEDFVKYRFDKNCERLERDGKENIKDQYKKMKETVVNTVNHIVDLSSPVDDIFSDMELEKSQYQGVKITYQSILEGLCYTSDDPLILLEGDPGVGKTTLVKKVISEWMNDTKSVAGLNRYSLVLHHEFRNEITKDFITLLKDRMPDIAKSLKDEELKKASLHVKSLIILDGLDEVNDVSVLLFEEVLKLKKNYGITVMITSRPEKLNYLKSRLNAQQIKLKHICLLGILIDQREDFVEKYHKKMTEENNTKQGINTPDIKHLKKYLEETKYRLKNLWRLPYNLTLITILYVSKLIDLYNITTAPELYQEIFRLYRTKLKERLRDFPETKMLQDSELESIIDIFIHSLTKESIIGLMKSQINLPEEAYKRLEGVCKYIKVPAEQMIGAFLKVVPNTSSLILYGYPHKGIQDYLSARYIWMLLTGDYQSMEIQKIISNVFSVLSSHPRSAPYSHRIMRVVEKELKENERCYIKGINQQFDAENTIPEYQSMDTHKVIRDVFSALSRHSGSPHFSQRIMRVVEDELKERDRCHIKGISQQLDAESTIKGNEVYLIMNSVPKNIIDENTKFLRKRLKAISGGEKQTSRVLKFFRTKKGPECDQNDAAGESKQSLSQESTTVRDQNDAAGESKQPLSQESTTVRDILQEIQEECFPRSKVCQQKNNISKTDSDNELVFDISKYQNMLMCLLGLFNSERKDIPNEMKLEILNLLKLTGVKDKGAWINLLINVNCDSFVAEFITRENGIFSEIMEIDDSSLIPYTSLLNSLKSPPEKTNCVTLNIHEATNSQTISPLLHQLNRLNMEVTNMEFHYDFRNPSACQDPKLQTEIGLIMKRCPLERYTGSMMNEMSFSHSLIILSVSVTTKEEIKTLNSFIKQSLTLRHLSVCVSADVDHKNFIPIHHPRVISPSLYIVDITKMHNLMNCVNIIKSLQPLNGDKKFRGISFPRCNLNINPLDLIKSLGRIMIKGILSDYLQFPSSLKPQQQQQQQLVQEEGNRKLRCNYVV